MFSFLIKCCCCRKLKRVQELNNSSSSDGSSEGNLENECSICLCSMNNKEKLVALPCGHVFHHVCIYLWYLKQFSCPICREIIHNFY